MGQLLYSLDLGVLDVMCIPELLHFIVWPESTGGIAPYVQEHEAGAAGHKDAGCNTLRQPPPKS